MAITFESVFVPYNEQSCHFTRVHAVVTDNFLPTEEQYICTDDYSPSNSDEMALEKGTVVKVVEKNLDGWWWIR